MKPTTAAPERYVSVAEIKQRLGGVSTSTVYRMIDAGELARPSRVTLRRVGWPLGYVERLLASRMTAEQMAPVQ